MTRKRWAMSDRFGILGSGILLVGWLLSGPAWAEPRDWYVVTNQVAVSDGTNWVTAFTNVQDALDSVIPEVTNVIHLAGHIFDLTNVVIWTGQENVIMRGGYDATENNHDPDNQVTVLRRNATHGDFRVMFLDNLSGCRLEHVTVTDGHVKPRGGGLWVRGSTVSIVDCVISNNKAEDSAYAVAEGAGICVTGGAVDLLRCRITDNRSFNSWRGAACGGGLYVTGGGHLTVNHSVIDNNKAEHRPGYGYSIGAGAYQNSDSVLWLRNCLITGNENLPVGDRSRHGAGVALSAGGVVENCTISANRMHSLNHYGAGLWVGGGMVTNTIVFGNLRAGSPNDIGFGVSANEAGNVFYSCAPELSEGVNNNTVLDPMFLDAATGDFRLDRGSPCVDTGYAAAWMTEAVDLDGNPRIQAGRPDRPLAPDRGAYETSSLPDEGDLVCDFVADIYSGIDEMEVVFTAFVGGSETNITEYRWDFNNNGTNDLAGADKWVVTNTYAPGLYTVRLEVENDQLDTAMMTKTGYVYVAPSVVYVWLGASGEATGINWDNAYTNVQTAIDQPGVSEIRVAGGDYGLTEQLHWISHSGQTIRGGYDPVANEHDPENQVTVFDQTGSDRVLKMIDLEDCRLKHVTIANGDVSPRGGGMEILNSSVVIADCIISNNLAWAGANDDAWGGGIYVTASSVTISNSVFTGNKTFVSSTSKNGMPIGGALCAIGASSSLVVVDCAFIDNEADSQNAYGDGSQGGAIYMNVGDGLIRNTRIIGNRVGQSQSTGSGGGVFMCGGTMVENSVIVSNRTFGNSSWGGGFYMDGGGELRNCLVARNSATGSGSGGGGAASGGLIESTTVANNSSVNAGTVAGIYLSGSATVTNAIFYANYRQNDEQDASVSDSGGMVTYSCIVPLRSGVGNIGADPGFVDAANGDYRLQRGSPAIDDGITLPWMPGTTDLAGLPRVMMGRVDMGCYETIPPRGTLFMAR